MPDGVRLYTLDGGHIRLTGPDADALSDDGSYTGRTIELSVPAFLIRHPDGNLMWGTGISPTRTDIGDAASAGPSLLGQLKALGVAPADIRFLVVSHAHWDHSGNAGLFAGATWIVNPDERAFMFDDESRASPAMDDYGALDHAQRLLIWEDHDVFGDGSVVIMQTPGHTVGHCALLVRLATGAPVMLSGDLWHQAESRRLRLVPTYNSDRTQTLASMDRVEELVTAMGARVIVQHDLADYTYLAGFPTGMG